MPKPIIAIVGRPNVGKSTLFNRLTGRSKAIIKNVHGVTRDRNYSDIQWDDSEFTIIDTGGFFPEKEDDLLSSIRRQALYAIDEADLTVHLLDGKEGLNPLDMELATVIRKSGRNTVWAVNKIDTPDKEDRLADFYGIGAEELMPISAESGLGIEELMEKIISMVPEPIHSDEPGYPKIAIVGRPNVGKSTIVNTLLGKERMIVSALAGTTRDSVDSMCTYYRKKYTLIDTAGIRRKPRVSEALEELSVLKSIKSIERSDIVVAVLDSTQGIVDQDQKIIGISLKKGKGLLILFNKWDLIEDTEKTYKNLMKQIHSKLWYVEFAPVLTTSALSKKRLFKIFPIINEILSARDIRISTPVLNRFKETIENSMPTHRGRKVKLFYITQTGIRPPSFTLFVNYPEGIRQQHMKLIERLLRKKHPFMGTPVRIYIRGRRK